MRFPGSVLVAVFASVPLFGREALGPLAEARQAYPTVFLPGNVVAIDVAGVPHYAFSGEAEQLFEGEFAESDAELDEEALLDARERFYRHLTEDDPSRTVEMRGATDEYHYYEGPVRRVVCIVPKSAVHVSGPKPVPETVPADKPVEVVLDGQTRESPPPDEPKGVSPDAAEPDGTTLDQKIQKCRERIDAEPENPLLRRRAAKLYAEQGRLDRANRHYWKMVQILGKENTMSKEDKAPMMMEAADFASRTGHYAQALKTYRMLQKWNVSEYQQEITRKISGLVLRMH